MPGRRVPGTELGVPVGERPLVEGDGDGGRLARVERDLLEALELAVRPVDRGIDVAHVHLDDLAAGPLARVGDVDRHDRARRGAVRPAPRRR